MSRPAAVVFSLLLAMVCVPQPAAAASKLVALVISNTSDQPGSAAETDAKERLEKLSKGLFKYTSEALSIIESNRESKSEIQARIDRFKSMLPGKDAALVIYMGPAVHDASETYLVPAGATGKPSDQLVPLHGLLDALRREAKGKALVFMDIVRRPAAAGSGLVDGVGAISTGADDDILVAQAASSAVDAKATLFDKLALLLGKQEKTVKLPRLAALVQQDVMFDSGGLVVPRITGALAANELSMDEQGAADRYNKCVAANEKFAPGAVPANFAGLPAGREQTAARFSEPSANTPVLNLYRCPFFAPFKPDTSEAPTEAPVKKRVATTQEERPRRDPPVEKHYEPPVEKHYTPPPAPSGGKRGYDPTAPGG